MQLVKISILLLVKALTTAYVHIHNSVPIILQASHECQLIELSILEDFMSTFISGTIFQNASSKSKYYYRLLAEGFPFFECNQPMPLTRWAQIMKYVVVPVKKCFIICICFSYASVVLITTIILLFTKKKKKQISNITGSS